MKLFFLLGNQLFSEKYLEKYKKDHFFFMAEDYQLCTYEKHHKQKILLFLSCMRSHADRLKKNKFKLEYSSIEDKSFKLDYTEKLKKIIKAKKIKEISSFEIEDKFFENKITNFLKKEKIKWNIIQTPMFLNSREKFKNYLSKSKKPFMAVFYKETRRDLDILMKKDGNPEGGKWSFDEENRNKLPKNISIPKFPKITETVHTKKLKILIDKNFKSHPGNTKDFWFATEYDDVIKLLNFFIKEKSNLFGDYEDAVDQKDNILFHSALSPYINLGLITPEFIIKKVLDFNNKNKIRLNSLEGYIRQVIGWREFMRGIYQSYSKEMETRNFFKQNRKMKNSWYEGTTGLPPLDYAIKNAVNYGWSHHIERLMILSNIMNLCEVKPTYVYKWFMEMFVDSSDWVMVPNVYGMGLFSDGGIFATKPYICGSAYFMKMMDFKKGEWCNTMDGLYWRFINRNRAFFLKNPRLSMMVRIFDKMKPDRKKLILAEAEKFIKQNTA
ncbi:deoxyribodipyrimidine photolyase [Pelagibacteraceae bacterium GOM-A1]|nr:deoxyribodipyrimidine photolyase [Pelagibacteraceae bacterium GOM-A1]